MSHGYATYGDDPEFSQDYYAEPAEQARHDLDELFAAVDGLRAAVEETDERVRQDVADLTERLESGGGHEQQDRLDVLGRQLERLQQQVQALERAVRVSDGVPQVNLDDVGPETRTLAAEAARWDDLHKELVTKEQRARYAEEIAHLDSVRGALAQCDADLRDVIGVLASTDRASRARGDAESRLRALTTRRRTLLDEEIPAAVSAAETARLALREADAVEARVVPQLERAERAWHDLQVRLRTRITDALGSNALLPAWFGHALGVAPPSGTSGDAWIRTAASVLAYRVTFGVTDPALPLGTPAPEGADTTERRWTWRARLESDLDDLSL
jgi:polyhydroxyalkanoate synthesis regulator phasin